MPPESTTTAGSGDTDSPAASSTPAPSTPASPSAPRGTGAGGGGASAASPSSSPAVTPPPPPDDDEVMSTAEATKLRREHQQLRKRLGDMEAAEQRRVEAQLSEEQRREKVLADREAAADQRAKKAEERIVTAALRDAGTAAGVPPGRASLLPKLIDREAVELDSDGEPVNADALVRSFLRDYPDFMGPAKPPPVTGSADGGARTQPESLTLDQIKAMKPDEINRRWPEITEAMRGMRPQ
jgi:hypothetical protein